MLSTVLTILLAAVPLVDAVKTGDRAAALAMIEQRVNVNTPEADGTTALHWAIHRNDMDLVDRLLRAGAAVKTKNDFGAGPMSEAALLGNAVLLDKLLKAGADVESPNADGQTALMVVARTGNVEAARVLLSHGANVNAREQWREQTALMWAAAQNQPAMVKELVAHGADVNARSKVNNWERQVTAEPRAIYRPAGGLTPLLYSSREGCVECTRILAEAGADLNMTDPEGVTPLLLAVLNDRYNTAAYLIQKGANVNKWDWFGRTPLYIAVDLNTIPRGGRPDRPSLDETTSLQIIEQLLAAGANPNAQLKLAPPFRNIGNDRGLDGILGIGTTPLIRAAKALDAPAVRFLLEKGANVNLNNVRGITPTMAAAGVGSVDADTRGIYTTEDVQQRSIATLELLLKAGGEINAKENNRGSTPLHEAARWGWNDVVKYLVDHGADLNAKDNRGMTPVDSAMGKAGGNSRGGARIDIHQDTADLLKKLMAAKQ
ncbi:MAG TPA: ankyrin repeat domain-containing protein [Terriglobia bacterium]|nr:ankyrin repeat domain-containing protein [Terriglobia bacterium]